MIDIITNTFIGILIAITGGLLALPIALAFTKLWRAGQREYACKHYPGHCKD